MANKYIIDFLLLIVMLKSDVMHSEMKYWYKIDQCPNIS